MNDLEEIPKHEFIDNTYVVLLDDGENTHEILLKHESISHGKISYVCNSKTPVVISRWFFLVKPFSKSITYSLSRKIALYDGDTLNLSHNFGSSLGHLKCSKCELVMVQLHTESECRMRIINSIMDS